MTDPKSEHKTRLVHNWTDAEGGGFRCAPGKSAFSRDDTEKTCRGCGAVVSLNIAYNVARVKNFERLASWVVDKAYHDLVDPCGCVGCEARNAAFWHDRFGESTRGIAGRERMTITAADVGTIEAAEVLGAKKAKK